MFSFTNTNIQFKFQFSKLFQQKTKLNKHKLYTYIYGMYGASMPKLLRCEGFELDECGTIIHVHNLDAWRVRSAIL